MSGSHSLWEVKLSALIQELASTEPTPGGGSCAMAVACMGAALLKKAFAVSVRKEKMGTAPSEELEHLMKQVDDRINILREKADRDAAAFESYLSALRLPQRDSAEADTRRKAVEVATSDATTLPLSAAEEIKQIAVMGIKRLRLVHPVMHSDALVGLQLLIASARCLFVTAEDNLSSLTESPCRLTLETRLQELRREMMSAERELKRYCQSRAQTMSS